MFVVLVDHISSLVSHHELVNCANVYRVFKQSVKQPLERKSTFENNIYRTVAFCQVLLNRFQVRGSV